MYWFKTYDVWKNLSTVLIDILEDSFGHGPIKFLIFQKRRNSLLNIDVDVSQNFELDDFG